MIWKSRNDGNEGMLSLKRSKSHFGIHLKKNDENNYVLPYYIYLKGIKNDPARSDNLYAMSINIKTHTKDLMRYYLFFKLIYL